MVVVATVPEEKKEETVEIEAATEIKIDEKTESETTEATFSFDAPVSKVEEPPQAAEEAMEMTLDLGQTSKVSETPVEEKPKDESAKEEKRETADDAVESPKKKKQKKKTEVQEEVVEEKVEKISAEKKKKKKKSEKTEEESLDVTLTGAAAAASQEAEANVVIELAEDQKQEETTQEVETMFVLEEAATEEKTETQEVIVETASEEIEEPAEADALVFDVPLADLTVKAGEEAKLFVKVTGQPEPWVKWFRDGTEIKGSGKLDMLTSILQSTHSFRN